MKRVLLPLLLFQAPEAESTLSDFDGICFGCLKAGGYYCTDTRECVTSRSTCKKKSYSKASGCPADYMCTDFGTEGIQMMGSSKFSQTFTAHAGEPCSLIILNGRPESKFKIELEGKNINTYLLSVDFPFETKRKSNANTYVGNKGENAIFMYVGSTTDVAQRTTLTYS